MIILDTNIISELIKTNPDEKVFQWFGSIEGSVVLTAITIGELQQGVMSLPEGKRKQNLLSAIGVVLDEYKSHILHYDEQAALAYGALCASLKSKGIGVGQSDVMIASIALVHGATLATRNTKDFAHCGIALVNPFD